MSEESNTVVFVSASQIADLVHRTRQRLSNLVADLTSARPNSVLPATRVRINGNPAWRLDAVVPALAKAKYPVSESAVRLLIEERSVPASTIPVGVTEAAEVLAVSSDALRKRSRRGRTAPELFRFGVETVWDLDALVDDARMRGFAVNEAAEAKWREVNRSAAVVRREVEVVARIKLSVPAIDDDSRLKAADDLVRSILIPAEASNPDRVRVIGVEVQAVTEASASAS